MIFKEGEYPEADIEVRERLLQKLAISNTKVLPGQMLADLSVNFKRLESIANQMIMEMRTFVLAEKLGSIDVVHTFEYPSDWWQAFRARWLPKKWLSWRPVRMKKVTKCTTVGDFLQYPDLSVVIPKGQAYVRVRMITGIRNYPDTEIEENEWKLKTL